MAILKQKEKYYRLHRVIADLHEEEILQNQ